MTSRNTRWMISTASLAVLVLGGLATPAVSASEVLPRLTSEVVADLHYAKSQSIFTIYDELGEVFGIDVAFDWRMRDRRQSVSLRGVTVAEALDRVTSSSGLIWVATSDDSVLIAEENPQNRRRYDRLVMQTFYLKHAEPKTILTVLRSLTGVKNFAADNALNAVTVRDTAAKVAVIQRLVEQHDRSPAFVEIDLRVLAFDPEGLAQTQLGRDGHGPDLQKLAQSSAARELGGAKITATPRSPEVLRLEEPRGNERVAVEVEARPTVIPAVGGAASIELELSIAAGAYPNGLDERSSKARLQTTMTLTRSLSDGVADYVGFRLLGDTESHAGEHGILVITPKILAPSKVTAADARAFTVGTTPKIEAPRDR